MGIKTKLNARLAIWQRADLFEASNSANKISLPLRCFFFWHFFDDQIISCFTHHLYPDKTADISRRHHWFPRGKRSHRRSQKTRHHLDLIASSVWNFCARFSVERSRNVGFFRLSGFFFVVIARSPGSDSTEVLFPLTSFKFWYLTVLF